MKAEFVGSGTGANFPIVMGAMDAFMTSGIEIGSLTATSGSSIIFAAIAGGNHPSTLKHLAQDLGPGKIIRKNWRPFTPGIFHLDRLQAVLKPLVPRTFGESKAPLTIIATDSDTGNAVYFSTISTPDRPVAKVVQASSSVPWLFRHVVVNGRRLVDGGVVNNFAIDHPRGPLVIGIRVLGARSEMRRWTWWPDYSANMFAATMQAVEREHVEDVVWDSTKILTVKSPIGSLDFHKLDPTMIEILYMLGFQEAQKMVRGVVDG